MHVAGSLAFMVPAIMFWTASPARAASDADCKAADGASFICGVTNVEDFAPVPDTKWVIGSDLAAKSHPQGYLYLFDTKERTASAVEPSEIAIRPDKKTYPDCPGPYDVKTFGPHGLDLTRTGGMHRVLYAVNHGGRESVEVFDVDLTGARPRFTWTGCVVAPPKFWPDAVASLPDGGIVVTSLWDPTDPDRVKKLSRRPAGWCPGRMAFRQGVVGSSRYRGHVRSKRRDRLGRRQGDLPLPVVGKAGRADRSARVASEGGYRSHRHID